MTGHLFEPQFYIVKLEKAGAGEVLRVSFQPSKSEHGPAPNAYVTSYVKVHLAPKFSFGRDETLQHIHKEFDNIISIWYF